MMGQRQIAQGALFYEFNLQDHVPGDHLLRSIDRVRDRFDLWPERLIADTAYGSGEMLGWLVEERSIELHIPVIDKSKRTDGTFSSEDFVYDHRTDTYTCPAG